MIYINNSTNWVEIPRFSAKLGSRFVLINQITKGELSVDFEDDGLGSYYRISVSDIVGRMETGQYDYYVYGDGSVDLGKGILQFDDFTKKVVEYNDDIEVVQYTPDMEYTPVPDRVLKIEENGVYDVKLYDKAEVEVPPELTKLPNGVQFRNSTWTECPSFDYINLTTAHHLFYQNDNLVKIGEMVNTGNITDMDYMFYWCRGIITIPQFDTSKVTSMENMFLTCSNLISVPFFDTSKVTDMYQMFANCFDIISVPQFDTSNVTNIKNMLYSCNKLTDLGGFTNLGKAFTDAQTLYTNSSYLTNQSVQNIIDTVYDMNLNTTGGSATLKLAQSVINSMTDEQKSKLAAKGWTLTN